MSIVLGAVACGSSLLLLWAALDSWNPNGLFADWKIPPMPYGKVITMIYLKVSISDFLTLFSARTHEGFFWSARPSAILMIAAMSALGLSTLLACIWPNGHTDKIRVEGLTRGDYTLMPLWVWIYCVVWWWIQDLLKVVCYWLMHRYNVFDINTTMLINKRDANAVDDKRDPLARHSVGLVEGKLLAAKVEDAQAKLEHLARRSDNAAGLQRVSQSMARVSANLAAMKRSSLNRGSAAAKGDVEGGHVPLEEAVEALEGAAAQAGQEMDPVSAGSREFWWWCVGSTFHSRAAPVQLPCISAALGVRVCCGLLRRMLSLFAVHLPDLRVPLADPLCSLPACRAPARRSLPLWTACARPPPRWPRTPRRWPLAPTPPRCRSAASPPTRRRAGRHGREAAAAGAAAQLPYK